MKTRVGKTKRCGLTATEIDARFPGAMIAADMHLSDLSQGPVQITVTRAKPRRLGKSHRLGKLQWRAMTYLGVLYTQANWHQLSDDFGVWVRLTVGFRWRGNRPRKRIQAGSVVYLAPNGSVRAEPPRAPGAYVQPIGVAITEPDDHGCIRVLLTSPLQDVRNAEISPGAHASLRVVNGEGQATIIMPNTMVIMPVDD